tara:strand:- start:6428 stop:6700 length:273 start_codon:yes stop_codon:yes gene_type:complete
MSTVQFDEPTYKSPVRKQSTQHLLADFLVRNNLAKNNQQATYMILGIAILAIIISLWMISSSRNVIENPPPELIDAEQPIGVLPLSSHQV